jgi:SAM-dependent methyltransferase
MSRDSGAGAYSQGICWPSPRPHVDGVSVPRPTVADRPRGTRARSVGWVVRRLVAATSAAYTLRSRHEVTWWSPFITTVGEIRRTRYPSGVKRLAHAPELLDGPLDRETLAGNLRDLERVNRRLGGVALSRRALLALITGLHAGPRLSLPHGSSEPVRLLDVGTGAADIPEALIAVGAFNGIGLNVVAIDSREEIVDVASERIGERADFHLEVANGERLPFEASSFDIAHTSMVLHHLEPVDAARLIGEMARVARLGIVVNDLDRGWWYWLGAWLLSHSLTRNRYTRTDAPLSVRRAYHPAEVAQFAARVGLIEVARIRGFLGHRYALAFVHAEAADAADAAG